MSGEILGALALVLFGGLLNGSFVAPMKKLRGWHWEHGWLVYSVAGLLVIPWIYAWATMPALGRALADSPPEAWRAAVAFGFGWGIGSVLFGLGVARMGLAVGYGLILGLIAPIGTFYPLVVQAPEKLLTRQGATLLAGTAVVLAGIFVLAAAGRIRERSQAQAQIATPAKTFLSGVILCILAGIFSPMLNFAFVFGEGMRKAASAAGNPESAASNALWAVTLAAGFFPNGLYALGLMLKNRTTSDFAHRTAANAGWATLMGLLCYGSFVTYGMGAARLGKLGGVVGWPLFMSMSLIASNSLGALTGEWRGAPKRAVRLSVFGIAALVIAIIIIAMGKDD